MITLTVYIQTSKISQNTQLTDTGYDAMRSSSRDEGSRAPGCGHVLRGMPSNAAKWEGQIIHHILYIPPSWKQKRALTPRFLSNKW